MPSTIRTSAAYSRLVSFTLTNGVRFYSIAHVHKIFAPLGLRPTHTTALLRALGIPILRIGNFRFINMFWLSVVLFHISRPGGGDVKFQLSTFKLKDPIPRDIPDLQNLLLELLYAESINLQLPATPASIRAATLDALSHAVASGLSSLSDGACAELRARAQAFLAKRTSRARIARARAD